MKFSILSILLVCASGALAQPNSSFYVATTGNDSNPGTQASPWRTIQHAADTARAGSTVNVRGGIYEEVVSINASGNTSDRFITFRSCPISGAVIVCVIISPTQVERPARRHPVSCPVWSSEYSRRGAQRTVSPVHQITYR